MTEQEWLTGTDPRKLLKGLPRRSWGERRGYLFAAECCRRLGELPGEGLASIVEVALRCADRAADDAEHSAAIRAANLVREVEVGRDATSWRAHAATAVAAAIAYPAEEYTAIDAVLGWTRAKHGPVRGIRKAATNALADLADLVRELTGNPFRPVTLDPSWLTSTVVQLARGIYDDRAFDRMPILADALQDAGCDNDDVLKHCRGDGPHARGCWVVDLLLGKG